MSIIYCGEYYVNMLNCTDLSQQMIIFVFHPLKVLQTVSLLSWFFCVQVFRFQKICISCLSLSLNFELRKMPPGKFVSWKKALKERMHNPYFALQKCLLKINHSI